MISGKANFDYFQFKDKFFIDTRLSIQGIAERDLKSPNLSQIILISEDLNSRFNHIHIQPLSDIRFDLFQNVIEIHLVLLSNKELSNSQKLDYTKLQRYFMKMYLSEIIKKGNLE